MSLNVFLKILADRSCSLSYFELLSFLDCLSLFLISETGFLKAKFKLNNLFILAFSVSGVVIGVGW